MKMFKKADLIIILGVILLGACALLITFFAGNQKPGYVRISVNGKNTAVYPLDTDREFTVTGFDGGEVHGFIKDGVADVSEATCPDKICVNHSVIKRTGESIVCLPNRVVITVIAADNEAADGSDTVDAVAGD